MHGQKSRVLKLSNFGLFREANVQIKPGVSIVFGHWEDDFLKSNGAGKSMLVGSLLYVFTGKTPRMPWQDSFSVRFETDAYWIHRERVNKTHKVEFKYGETLYSGRLRDVSVMLSSIFGDENVLNTLYFAIEGAQLDFWKMSPSARYSFLQDVFNLANVEEYKQKALLLVRDKKRRITSITDELLTIQEQIKDYEQKLKQLDETELMQRVHQLRDRIKEEESIYSQEEEQLQNIMSLVRRRELLLKDYLAMSQKLEQQRARRELLEKQLKELSSKISKLKELYEKYANVDFDKKIDEVKSKEQQLRKDLEALRTQEHVIIEKQALLKEGKCPTCGRPFTHQDFISLSLPDLKQVQQELKNKERLIEELRSKVDKLIQAKTKFAEVEMQYKEALSTQNKLMEELEIINAQAVSSVDNLKKELDQIERELSGIEYDDLLRKHKERYAELSRLRAEEKELEMLLSKLRLFKEEHEKLLKRQTTIKEELSRLESDLPAYERVSFYFSSGMVLNTFLSEILGFAEEKANSFLVMIGSDLRLSFGSVKELKSGKKRPEIILNIFRGNSSISPSSGESIIVSIALRLAFAELHKKLDFFVFDESFAFLDDYNAAMVIDALQSFVDYGYYGVILVSNKQLLREMSGVNHIVVRRIGDESIVVSE